MSYIPTKEFSIQLYREHDRPGKIAIIQIFTEFDLGFPHPLMFDFSGIGDEEHAKEVDKGLGGDVRFVCPQAGLEMGVEVARRHDKDFRKLIKHEFPDISVETRRIKPGYLYNLYCAMNFSVTHLCFIDGTSVRNSPSEQRRCRGSRLHREGDFLDTFQMVQFAHGGFFTIDWKGHRLSHTKGMPNNKNTGELFKYPRELWVPYEKQKGEMLMDRLPEKMRLFEK